MVKEHLKPEVEKIRKEFELFKSSENRKFSFIAGNTIEDRIKFIYAVIFPGLKKYSFFLRHIISRTAYFIDYSPAKVVLYRLAGVKIGKGVFISPQVVIDPHFTDLIEIEDHAIIGYGANIFTHELSGMKYSAGRVKIGRGAIVGAFSSIRAGVEIKENTTVPWQSNIYYECEKKHEQNI